MNKKAEIKAIKYIQDFTDSIGQCEDIHDYFDLVLSVFIFNNLVNELFLDSCEDRNDREIMLSDLKMAAKIISERVISQNEYTGKGNKEDLN